MKLTITTCTQIKHNEAVVLCRWRALNSWKMIYRRTDNVTLVIHSTQIITLRVIPLSDQIKNVDYTYYMIDKSVPKSTPVFVLSSIFLRKSITCHRTCCFGIKTDIYLSNAREVTRTIHKNKWGSMKGEFGWKWTNFYLNGT